MNRCIVRIKHSRNAVNIAQIKLVITVLGASGSEDDSIISKRPGKFRIVFSGLHPSIAACHDKKFPDRAGLDRVNDFVGKGDHLIVGKTADNISGFNLLRRRKRFAISIIAEKSLFPFASGRM